MRKWIKWNRIKWNDGSKIEFGKVTEKEKIEKINKIFLIKIENKNNFFSFCIEEKRIGTKREKKKIME